MSVVQLEPPRDAWDDRTVSELLALASSRSADDRQRLLLKVTSLCESNPPPPKVAPLLSDIFLALTAQAERDIRLALSERIAGVDWAPPALVNMLALDEIEIARPVITSSPRPHNADLIRLLTEAALEHQSDATYVQARISVAKYAAQLNRDGGSVDLSGVLSGVTNASNALTKIEALQAAMPKAAELDPITLTGVTADHAMAYA